MTPTAAPNPAPNAIPKEVIKQAITEAKVLLKDGKPKIEAAKLIFQKLKGADKDTVVQAFIEGAALTEKGAVTYWYNCRRKIVKPASK
jgi:hypothetical protein